MGTREILFEEEIAGGKHWSFTIARGMILRLIDVQGGANVGMLFYNPLNLLERYNAPDTAEVPAHVQAVARSLPLLRHGAHLLLDRRGLGRLARHGLRQHHPGDGRRALGTARATRSTATTGR